MHHPNLENWGRAMLIMVLLLTATFTSAYAQQSSLQGIITDYSSGEPLYGANVVLQPLPDGALQGTAADNNGFYRIGEIREGRYALRISYIGYRAHLDTLSFDGSAPRTASIALRPDENSMGEVVVEQRGDGAAWRSEGIQRITQIELGRVPSPATGDLASYLQTLPGVVSMGDRGGQVYIRGGTPTQNLVLVDGAMVYRPMHIVGFFSPFPQDLVSGVDFYAGGFGPRYNSRISSVMDVQLRHGNRFNTSATATISPFAGELTAEGPLSEGESSWILSVRNSLIEHTTGGIYPVEKQPLRFGSQLLKTSLIDDASRCSAMLMNTYDRGRMDFERDDTIKWQNFVMGGRCVALPENSRTLLEANVNISSFSNSRIDPEGSGFSSGIWRINLDLNLRQYSGLFRFDYGFFVRLNRLNYNMDEEFLGLSDQDFSEYVAGGHFETSIPLGERIHIRPGTAISLSPGNNPLSLEPRFRFSWTPDWGSRAELTGAAGIYRQSMVGVSDMRDASSIFVAWMDAPADEAPMNSIHTLLGWQQEMGSGFTYSVEGFYKELSNQPVPQWSTIAQFTTDLVLADGETFGGDFRLEYQHKGFYGMLGYGYSNTLYTSSQDQFGEWFGEPVQDYHPPHDRRHQVNALFSLDISNYTVGLRWQFGTGTPFTQPIGFDNLLDYREGLPDVKNDRGLQRVIIDKPFQGRLPATHRLDLSVERSFRLGGPGTELTARLGAVNIYDQQNIFFYDLYTQRRIDQLPLAPYLTLELGVGK